MFEDINEPEDIFSQADKIAPQVSPPTNQPSAPAAAPQQSAPTPEHGVPMSEPQPTVKERIAAISSSSGRSIPWKPIVLVVAILVVVAGAFYLSVQILSSRTPVTPEPPVDLDDQGSRGDQAKEEKEEPAEAVVPLEAPKEEAVLTADTDKDGLTDAQEAEAGTSPRAADTDGDGLFDPEELNTWKTDPLDPDTDGDGYLDGAEVSAGYNPNGDGQLLTPPTESD